MNDSDRILTLKDLSLEKGIVHSFKIFNHRNSSAEIRNLEGLSKEFTIWNSPIWPAKFVFFLL